MGVVRQASARWEIQMPIVVSKAWSVNSGGGGKSGAGEHVHGTAHRRHPRPPGGGYGCPLLWERLWGMRDGATCLRMGRTGIGDGVRCR